MSTVGLEHKDFKGVQPEVIKRRHRVSERVAQTIRKWRKKFYKAYKRTRETENLKAEPEDVKGSKNSI